VAAAAAAAVRSAAPVPAAPVPEAAIPEAPVPATPSIPAVRPRPSAGSDACAGAAARAVETSSESGAVEE